MDKYDKVVKRFGDADKAHAFLEAVSKEGPPLAPERKSPSTRSAARAPEMLAGHSHDMTFQVNSSSAESGM